MQVEERFVTSASPELIWQVLADVEHWNEWTPTVLEIEPLGNIGLSIGARYRVVQPKLRPAIYEVTECVPSRRFMWVKRLPGGKMTADHRITELDCGTEVKLSFASAGLIGNIIGLAFSRLVSDYVKTEAQSLKNRCDSLTG